MYLAQSQPEALALALLSMCCWGSWSNTVIFCGDRLRFELYYVNYVVGILVTAFLAALTLGMLDLAGCDQCDVHFIPDDLQAEVQRLGFGLAAGAIFNLANLLLTKSIQMCGLAVAFPLCIGTALVFGTLLTHFLENTDDSEPILLFSGVGVALLAVCTISLVHRLKDKQVAARDSQQERTQAAPQPAPEQKARQPELRLPELRPPETVQSPEEKSPIAQSVDMEAPVVPPAVSTVRKLLVCVVGGVLMSFWSPLNAMAQDGFASGRGLSPFGAFLAFCMGTFVSTSLLVPLVLRFPLEGSPAVPIQPVLQEYQQASSAAHAYGLLGGCVWAIGTLANSVSGQQLSFAASYAIGQSAPMVSILWGVFLFREFEGTSAGVKALLVLVCALYIISIALIGASH